MSEHYEYIDFYIHSHYETGEYLYADPVGIHYEHAFRELVDILFEKDSELIAEIDELIFESWPKYSEQFVRVGIDHDSHDAMYSVSTMETIEE